MASLNKAVGCLGSHSASIKRSLSIETCVRLGSPLRSKQLAWRNGLVGSFLARPGSKTSTRQPFLAVLTQAGFDGRDQACKLKLRGLLKGLLPLEDRMTAVRLVS